MSKNNNYTTPIKNLFAGTKLFAESLLPHESIDDFRGFTNYVYNNPKDASINFINHVKNHPLETVVGLGTLFVSPSFSGFVGETGTVFLNSGTTFLSTLGRVQGIYNSWNSMSTPTKIMSIALASLPVVSAWESYADARAAYGGGECYGYRLDRLTPFLNCAKDNNKLFKDCYEGMTFNNMEKYGQTFDGYVFAQHHCTSTGLNPVSITNYNTTEVCVYSVLQQDQNALKICFPSSNNSFVTVNYAKIPSSRVYEQMKPEVAIRHGAIHTEDGQSCAFFKKLPLSTNMDSQNTFCVVSQNGKIPQQTCVNPDSHEVLVRPITPEEFANYHTDSSSTYTIINDPVSRGLDLRPDTRKNLDTCSLSRPVDGLSPNPYYSNSTLPNIEANRSGFLNWLSDYLSNSLPKGSDILNLLSSRSDSSLDSDDCGVSLQGAMKAWWYQDPSYIDSDC